MSAKYQGLQLNAMQEQIDRIHNQYKREIARIERDRKTELIKTFVVGATTGIGLFEIIIWLIS